MTQLRRKNDLSSLKVSPGCCVTLFKDGNHGWERRKVCQNITLKDLGEAWNDKVSTMMIELAPWFENDDNDWYIIGRENFFQHK